MALILKLANTTNGTRFSLNASFDLGGYKISIHQLMITILHSSDAKEPYVVSEVVIQN